MIGIISDELTGVSIIEQIAKKYPKINIYLCKQKSSIEEKIEVLKNKKCKIIILSKVPKSLKEKYQGLNFISLEKDYNEEFFLFEEDIMCQAIDKGNQQKIEELITSTRIPKTKKILLRDPKMLWIMSLIEANHKNEIVNVGDLLVEEISMIIKKQQLNPQEEGIQNILI